jgi:hypothetical protein
MNGDGSPDLVWQNIASGDLYAWFMTGSGFVIRRVSEPSND